MIKVVFVFLLTIFSINSVSADSISPRDNLIGLDNVKIIGIGYDSAHIRPGYIKLHLSSSLPGMTEFFYLKKTNDALPYIFTVYTQKKALYLEALKGLNNFHVVTKIYTLD